MKIRCPADDGTDAHVALDVRLPLRIGPTLTALSRLRCPCGKGLEVDARPETLCVSPEASVDADRLARTVVTQARELDVLRRQLAPLLAVHDALVAAAALPGAGASPEAMVAAVRAQGAEAMRATVLSATVLCTRACEHALKTGTMDERIRALLEVVASAHDLWVDLPLPGAEVSRG